MPSVSEILSEVWRLSNALLQAEIPGLGVPVWSLTAVGILISIIGAFIFGGSPVPTWSSGKGNELGTENLKGGWTMRGTDYVKGLRRSNKPAFSTKGVSNRRTMGQVAPHRGNVNHVEDYRSSPGNSKSVSSGVNK